MKILAAALSSCLAPAPAAACRADRARLLALDEQAVGQDFAGGCPPQACRARIAGRDECRPRAD